MMGRGGKKRRESQQPLYHPKGERDPGRLETWLALLLWDGPEEGSLLQRYLLILSYAGPCLYHPLDLPKAECVDTNVAIIESHQGGEQGETRRTPLGGSIGSVRGKSSVATSRRERQMEKYIAKRLKQDARPGLLARLASVQRGGGLMTSAAAQDNLPLLSTKNLLLPSKRKAHLSKKDKLELRTHSCEASTITITGDENDDDADSDGFGSGIEFRTETINGSRPHSLTTSKAVASIPEAVSIDMLTAIASLRKSSLNPLCSSSEGEGEEQIQGRGKGCDDDAEDYNQHDDNGYEQIGDEQVNPSRGGIELNSNARARGSVPSLSIPRLPIPDKAYYVLVQRDPVIEAQRTRLPIYAEEQSIMETILRHSVTIICGETGSGKTTQVPQFLYEAGFGDPACHLHGGLIGVTQPRRVAALAVAQRIAQELGRPEHVAHQIRLESSVRPETRIKLMTDGVLLRELQGDFLLRRYSIILLDEAHERNLNTDILIGMLSRAVRLRNQMMIANSTDNGELMTGASYPLRPLRLVIMSATLNVDEFMSPRLFEPVPPLIKIDARQHPVTSHFARQTDPDHVTAAHRIIKKIHARLPPGGILVFLTGKREICQLARMLAKQQTRQGPRWRETGQDDDQTVMGPAEMDDYDDYDADEDDQNEEISRGKEKADNNNDTDDDDDYDDEFGINSDEDGNTVSSRSSRGPLHVLPLYSLLAPEEQMRVFAPLPEEDARLCVLATNVAETSLTIPGIRYVVDSGKVKVRNYDASLGASHYAIQWCSQASATQRAGRAGRLGPGHCYRLYSSAVYEQQFPPWAPPEIERGPVDGLVLQLAAMGIDRPQNFPLPTPLPVEAITGAQCLLRALRALAAHPEDPTLMRITGLGRRMSILPLAPIWSRLLIMALEGATVPAPLAIALVAVVSIGDPMIREGGGGGENLSPFSSPSASTSTPAPFLDGDLIYWARLFAEYEDTPSTGRGDGTRKAFCAARGLMSKSMGEMHQQFIALGRTLGRMYPKFGGAKAHGHGESGQLTRMMDREMSPLRRLIAQSLVRQAAMRIHRPASYRGQRIKLPAYRRINADGAERLEEGEDDGIAFLHSSSVLARSPPPALVYGELSIINGIPYLKYVTPVNLAWVDQAQERGDVLEQDKGTGKR